VVHRRAALVAGASAQGAAVLWMLQWSHALVTHGPTERDRMGIWLGMTWMDSASLLALAYLLLVPGVVLLLRTARRDSSRRAPSVLGWLAVGSLLLAAVATLVEFRVWEWGTYDGTFDGTTSPLWIAGPVRSIASAVVLTIALTGLASMSPVPVWLVAVLAIGTVSTFFVGGPLPPVPGLAWLAFAHLLDLDPLWVNAGVIFAASPVGLNVYIFAQHYEANVETASTAILVSTAISVVTVSALLTVLHAGRLAAIALRGNLHGVFHLPLVLPHAALLPGEDQPVVHTPAGAAFDDLHVARPPGRIEL
jgi:hypothetical protein